MHAGGVGRWQAQPRASGELQVRAGIEDYFARLPLKAPGSLARLTGIALAVPGTEDLAFMSATAGGADVLDAAGGQLKLADKVTRLGSLTLVDNALPTKLHATVRYPNDQPIPDQAAIQAALEQAAAELHAAQSSRTTHAAPEAVDACRLFARMLHRALAGEAKDAILLADSGDFAGSPAIAALARGGYRARSEREIRGSGYVVESLEAALWCFARADSFAEAVLLAVNLGDDADTTGAICGQLAGAHFGERDLPADWRAQLAQGDEIRQLALRLARVAP